MPQSFLRRSVRVAVAVTVLSALATVPGTATTPAADPPVRVVLGECSAVVTGPVETGVTVRIKSASGALKATLADETNTNGAAFVQCTTTRIASGDQIIVRLTATNALVSSFTVPAFSAHIDRATDVVVLTGPKNTAVSLETQGCDPGAVNCGGEATYQRTFSAQGRVTLDTTADHDLGGADAVDLEWSGAKGAVQWRMSVPYLDVRQGAAKAGGVAPIGEAVTVKLRRTGSTVLAQGTGTATKPLGVFATFLRKPNGTKVTPAIGDRLSAPGIAADAKVTMADLELSVGPTSFSFHCAPGTTWSKQLMLGTKLLTEDAGTAGGSGDVTETYLPDLSHGATLVVRCGTPSGDSIKATAVIP